MKKMLILMALVGCEDHARLNVEAAYPHLRCEGNDPALCEDLDKNTYLCFSLNKTYSNNVVCLEGVIPPREKLPPPPPKPCPVCTLWTNGNLEVTGTIGQPDAPTASNHIDTFYSITVPGK